MKMLQSKELKITDDEIRNNATIPYTVYRLFLVVDK